VVFSPRRSTPLAPEAVLYAMTAARIRVYNHIPDFIGLDNDAFAEWIGRLKQRLARRNPMAVPVQRTIDGAIEPLETAPDRDALLHGLLDQDLSTVARTTLLHLAGALPPLAGRIVCHLVPNGGNRGSGTGWGRTGFSRLCRAKVMPPPGCASSLHTSTAIRNEISAYSSPRRFATT